MGSCALPGARRKHLPTISPLLSGDFGRFIQEVVLRRHGEKPFPSPVSRSAGCRAAGRLQRFDAKTEPSANASLASAALERFHFARISAAIVPSENAVLNRNPARQNFEG